MRAPTGGCSLLRCRHADRTEAAGGFHQRLAQLVGQRAQGLQVVGNAPGLNAFALHQRIVQRPVFQALDFDVG